MVVLTNNEVLGAIAVVGAVVCLGSIVVLHVLPTGYNPVRNAVSDYGVGPYRRWYHAQRVTLCEQQHPARQRIVVGHHVRQLRLPCAQPT